MRNVKRMYGEIGVQCIPMKQMICFKLIATVTFCKKNKSKNLQEV